MSELLVNCDSLAPSCVAPTQEFPVLNSETDHGAAQLEEPTWLIDLFYVWNATFDVQKIIWWANDGVAPRKQGRVIEAAVLKAAATLKNTWKASRANFSL